MNVYAFDVDETLEISGGPVTFASLVSLRQEGHILGLCGNWGLITLNVDGWHNLFSFVGQFGPTKAEFLSALMRYVKCEEVVMVGNDHSRKQHMSPDDATAARIAGCRFICEDDFAKGIR